MGSWPNTYLGLPINGKPKSEAFWSPVIETIENRLSSWGSSHLSKGGRLTLIQATLSNLPIYCLSLYMAPKKGTNMMERLIRNFLWGDTHEKRGQHLIRWSKVKIPTEQGALAYLIFTSTIWHSWANGYGDFVWTRMPYGESSWVLNMVLLILTENRVASTPIHPMSLGSRFFH